MEYHHLKNLNKMGEIRKNKKKVKVLRIQSIFLQDSKVEVVLKLAGILQ